MVTRGATAQAGLCAVSASAGAGGLEQGRAGTAGAGHWALGRWGGPGSVHVGRRA